MKFILILSFLLTFLPGQNVQRLHVDETPDFLAVFDNIQALPVGDKCTSKKSEPSPEDEFFLPSQHLSIARGSCPVAPDIVAQTPRQAFVVPYAIRGPPNA